MFYKTTIEIWTDFDPEDMEINVLAEEAIRGYAICDRQCTDQVQRKDAPDGVRSFFAVTNEDLED